MTAFTGDGKASGFRKRMRQIAPVILFLFGITQAGATDLLNQVQALETGNQSNPAGYYTSAGGGNGAFGQFQERSDTLVDTGYMTKDSSGNYSWSGKNGATSADAFLSCSSCQVDSETQNLKNNWSALQSNGATSYIGKQGADGVTYNESALIECSQQLGASGCRNYLETGTCGGSTCSNTHLANDIALASASDASAITGGQNTTVDNSAIAQGGSISNGTALAGVETACSKEVADALKSLGQQEVNGAKLLATQPGTGFTTANGQSPLTSDGSIGGRNPFSIGSCLDSLRPGIGVNMIFNQGSSLLSGLADQIKSAMCNALRTTITDATQPAYNAVSGALSGVSSSLNEARIGGAMGGYIPSVGAMLGNTGFSMNASQTSLANSGVTINGQNYGSGSILDSVSGDSNSTGQGTSTAWSQLPNPVREGSRLIVNNKLLNSLAQ